MPTNDTSAALLNPSRCFARLPWPGAEPLRCELPVGHLSHHANSDNPSSSHISWFASDSRLDGLLNPSIDERTSG